MSEQRRWPAKVVEGRRCMNRIATSVILLILGCSYGSGPFEVVQGRDFPAERVKSEIHRSMKADEVRSVLGPPLVVVSKNGMTTWRYHVVEDAMNVTYLLGLIP